MSDTILPFFIPQANRSVTELDKTFKPSHISNLVLWYDTYDFDKMSLVFNDISTEWVAINSIDNAAGNASFNATKETISALTLNSGAMNGHHAIGNDIGNAAMATNYFPDGGEPFTVGFNVVLPALTTQSFFGANDATGRRFYVRGNGNGTLLFGIGNQAFTTTQTYAQGDKLTIVMYGDGSNFTAIVNDVAVIDNRSYSFPSVSNDEILLLSRKSSGNPTEYFNDGYLNGFCLYERALDSDERTQLTDYLKSISDDNLNIKIILAAGFRADITGASNLIITTGDMVSAYQGNGVSDAIRDVENRDSLSRFVSASGATALGDNIHFTAASSRIMGQRHFDAYNSE